jgi:hypothetical protein
LTWINDATWRAITLKVRFHGAGGHEVRGRRHVRFFGNSRLPAIAKLSRQRLWRRGDAASQPRAVQLGQLLAADLFEGEMK